MLESEAFSFSKLSCNPQPSKQFNKRACVNERERERERGRERMVGTLSCSARRSLSAVSEREASRESS